MIPLLQLKMKILCLPVLLLLLGLHMKADGMTFPSLHNTHGLPFTSLFTGEKGPANITYFNERKKWLADMKISLRTQPKKSKTDPRYYDPNLRYTPKYTVTINQPNICSQHHKVFLLIVIRTESNQFEWRAVYREILNHPSQLLYRKDIVVKYVFIIGKNPDPSVEQIITEEIHNYSDIIQGDFYESALNPMTKVPMAWDWVVKYCPNAEYVMINNIGVLVDVDKLVPFLLDDYAMTLNHDHFAVCYPLGDSKANHNDFKVYRDLDQKHVYQGTAYPPYCHDWGYVAHITLINQLHKATTDGLPPFMPIDVYAGVLSEKLGVNFQRDQNKYFIIDKVQQYFANPRYPVEAGMIAVTQFANPGREMEVVGTILQSMRQQWSIRDKNSFQPDIISETPPSGNCDYFFYIALFTLLTLLILLKKFWGSRSLRCCR